MFKKISNFDEKSGTQFEQNTGTKNTRMYRFLTIAFVILASLKVAAQDEDPPKGIVTKAVIIDGDTVPVFWIPEVRILGPRTFKSKGQAITWTKLVQNVKRVYPYAKLAGKKMKEYNELLRPVESKRERRRLIEKMQDELFAEFEGELRKLTITQGKILVKLIDRETSFTTYDIIKDYRGGIMAGFWQLAGSIFGYNLKEPYEPDGKDREIETICIMIENGTI